MFQNRLFNVYSMAIALALVVMTVLTVQAGLATKAVADRSYDQVEQQRGARSAAPADRSYDPLEALRENRSASAATVDNSDRQLRADAAYGARWEGLAQQYAQHTAESDSDRQLRADAAYGARWQGLAQDYVQRTTALNAAASSDELDELDTLRAHRSAAQPQADRSYDAIEQIRTIRGLQ